MKLKINDEFREETLSFLKSLKKESSFSFFPASKGLTNDGKSIDLGFSCLALKSFYILNEWENISHSESQEWVEYINSFQINNDDKFPNGSFVDPAYYKLISRIDLFKELKRFGKKVLNKNYKSKNQEIDEYIRAETKQAISTLHQVGSQNCIRYKSNIIDSKKMLDYLNSLNWKTPWTSGAQFSGLCVFLESQEFDNQEYILLKKQLITFSNDLLDKQTGCYFKESVTSDSEMINGAMKVLTGLDWLATPVHEPKNLIDTCLKIKPLSHGCDIVDIIYILYMCAKETTYKRKDIVRYLEEIELIISKHYQSDTGGFSYYLQNSQKYYYGLNITKGVKTADIHGTTLLLWAYSMINYIKQIEDIKLNLIKP